MKIIRNISSLHPDKCNMVVKGFLGNVKGSVIHSHNGIKDWYQIKVKNNTVGEATDFYHACDTLLNELGIIKTVYV